MSIEEEMSFGQVGASTPEEPEESMAAMSDREKRAAMNEAVAQFDLEAFMGAARSQRATVRLYARPDLDEEITRLRADAFEATQRGDVHVVSGLKAQIKRAQDAYFAQAIDIVVEERSKAWQARKLQELKDKFPGVSSRELELEILAAQIVSPAGGFTGKDLTQLAEVIPSQINTLIRAWGELSGREERDLPVF